MPSRFAAGGSKEISQLVKQTVPEIHALKKVTKFGLDVLTGKALFFFLR